jgi:hypothetical protein
VVRRWLAGHHEAVLLGMILSAGAALRLVGLNWDGGQWLHPDERQIYFVSLGLAWPHSLAEALRPDSPLNPHFFAYGSLPIYLLRLVSTLVAPLSAVLRDPDNLHLVGRPLAALFDLGTVYLTYRLAKRLGSDAGRRQGSSAPLLAAALASVAVLSIQLAHFYTADTLLTFFVVLALNLAADVARGAGLRRHLALGAAVGLALATKVSAAPLLLVVLVAFRLRRADGGKQQAASDGQDPTRKDELASRITNHASRTAPHASRVTSLQPIVGGAALAAIVAATTFVLVQPYALIDWRTFLAGTLRESQIAWGALDVPYTRQYVGTLPYLYSMWQTALWGLGLPLGLAGWAGFAMAAIRWLRRGPWADTLVLAWAGPYLAITGLFHTRYLRYMLPLVPVLCLFAAWLLAGYPESRQPDPSDANEPAPGSGLRRKVGVAVRWAVILLSLGYAVALVSVYTVPHSWITTSQWIYRTVPSGSTLAVEEWDTALPLPLNVDGSERRIEEYDVQVLTLYDEPDDTAKWSALAEDLAGSDYVVVASRRLYGSIPRSPDRYPLASRYYDLLFGDGLGFELAGEFGRGPGWLNPPSAPLPDAIPGWLVPDESAVVYDRPRALIFRNIGHLSASEILQRLGSP